MDGAVNMYGGTEYVKKICRISYMCVRILLDWVFYASQNLEWEGTNTVSGKGAFWCEM